MPQIVELDQNTINQIAAGEVIERPASVVKELMENAIDAKATAVTVEIKDGGLSLIRVTDDGCGIPKDQVPLAFLRHSTSKIRSAADLSSINSLGFRGEALSSIASVAKVEVITKTADDVTGLSYVIEGGEEKESSEIGAPDGTTFLVRDLFYNTPARRKFLKAAAKEGTAVEEVVFHIALSHPDLSVRFVVNGQTKCNTAGNGRLQDLIYALYGREAASGGWQVSEEGEDGTKLTGFLGKPSVSRGNRNFENYFVNGRYVKDKTIEKAIEDAYRPFLMQHRYPFTVLHLKVCPEDVDVNVHPAKLELRFFDEEKIYRFVYEAVFSILSGRDFIPDVNLSPAEEEKTEPKETGAEPFEKRHLDSLKRTESSSFAQSDQNHHSSKDFFMREEPVSPYRSTFRNQDKNENPVRKMKAEEDGQMELFDDHLLEKSGKTNHRLIGQLFDTYWLIEYEDSLFIMDQHAAHEKVLYEQIMNRLKSEESLPSQMQSPPFIVTVNNLEREVLEKNEETFRRLGYEVSDFGGKEIAISAVPDSLLGADPAALFTEILDGLTGDGHLTSGTILDRAAMTACKAAVKGNHRMSEKEADALIGELMTLENPYTCPHGRPTIIAISKTELEKRFGRIV